MKLKSTFLTLTKREDGKKRERRCLFDDPLTASDFAFEMGKHGWDWKMELIEYYIFWRS